ncbi:hypothetical protein [Metasolibacillus meyeri]|uniref:hypothetical protein n=1 Tax=Metasolibacillus meyeri TaxID=1071052 RepID=UPI000D31A224|nr:hypothetical protein [Metasolibacillus meyeri]
MRTSIIIQLTSMIVVGFLSGVACFYLFSLEQAIALIQLMDGRILQQQAPSVIQTILPVVFAIAVVLLFATHPFCAFVAKWLIALRATFLGFSSMYLLTQQKSLLAYGIWWFPFQFIYCILLLMICLGISTQRPMRFAKKGTATYRRMLAIILLFGIIALFEILVISYVFE